MSGKIMMALTRIEADTLWSKGLLQEALKVYTRLLSSSPHMTLNTKLNLEARVRLLQGELDNPSTEDRGLAIDAADWLRPRTSPWRAGSLRRETRA